MQTKVTPTETQFKMAESFHSMHSLSKFFVIPNAYDVPSARVFEEVGFSAVATSSAGIMVSLGYPDGESIPKVEFMSALRRIFRVLSIPLSVDLVSGFGRDKLEILDTVGEAIDAGAVGINLEDYNHSGNQLFSVAEQSGRIGAIRDFCDSLGLHLVINARTDAISVGKGDSDFYEAIERSRSYIDAGADCVYPMGLVDHDLISEFVREVNFPVNVMIKKGLPSFNELKQSGVNRVSFGPSASYATLGLLKRIGNEVLEHGSFEGLIDGTVDFKMLNSLARKQKRG